MAKMIAEDIRNILNKLDEFIVSEFEKPSTDDTVSDDSSEGPDDNSNTVADKPVDSMLKKPAGLSKVAGTLNPDELIRKLNYPEDQAASFRSALIALSSSDGEDDDAAPALTNAQLKSLAVAFNMILAGDSTSRNSVNTSLKSVGGINELDDNKVKSFIAMDKNNPAAQQKNGVDQMKDAISAVSKHGSQEDKDELGLTR